MTRGAVSFDVGECGKRVNVCGGVFRFALRENFAAADAHDALKADLFVVFDGGELQRIRVGERFIRKVEPNFHRQRCKGLDEDVVRQMAFARFGERAVQGDEKTVCLRVFFFKAARGTLRPHGVGAGGTCADAVKFLE